MLMIDWQYIFAGFVIGVIIGMTGVGGGSLMTPLLILWFQVSPAVAVGTDLLYAALTKCSGILAHQRRGNVCWRTVGIMAAGSIPGALLTIVLLRHVVTQGEIYDRILTIALGIALIATALILIYKNRVDSFVLRTDYPLSQLHRNRQDGLTIAAGMLLGILVTLSSVGAGVIGTATLLMLYPHLRIMQIVGTDLAHAVPITAIAGFGHMHLGTVDLSLLVHLLVGSLPGTFIGSHIGHRLPDKWVRATLACILLLTGLRLIPG